MHLPDVSRRVRYGIYKVLGKRGITAVFFGHFNVSEVTDRILDNCSPVSDILFEAKSK